MITIILFILLVFILVLAAIWWLSQRALFRPTREMHTFPRHHFENLYLEIDGDPAHSYTEDNRPKGQCLNIWYFNQHYVKYCEKYRARYHNPLPPKRTVLFFHGNSGNISHRDYVIDVCRQFGLDLLLVDYRGYGNSDGKPTSKNVRKDALLAYDFLRTRASPDEIIIWGESLGGSAAIYTAAHRRCRCLILISTFSCLHDAIFDCSMPKWFKYPVGHLVKWTVEPIPSKDWIHRVQCPVIIIHSLDDELINFSNACCLYDSVRHDCKMMVKIRGKHSAPIITENQLQVIFEFADIDTCTCSKEDMRLLLDNVRTVAVRKGLTEDAGLINYNDTC